MQDELKEMHDLAVRRSAGNVELSTLTFEELLTLIIISIETSGGVAAYVRSRFQDNVDLPIFRLVNDHLNMCKAALLGVKHVRHVRTENPQSEDATKTQFN